MVTKSQGYSHLWQGTALTLCRRCAKVWLLHNALLVMMGAAAGESRFKTWPYSMSPKCSIINRTVLHTSVSVVVRSVNPNTMGNDGKELKKRLNTQGLIQKSSDLPSLFRFSFRFSHVQTCVPCVCAVSECTRVRVRACVYVSCIYWWYAIWYVLWFM